MGWKGQEGLRGDQLGVLHKRLPQTAEVTGESAFHLNAHCLLPTEAGYSYVGLPAVSHHL